VGLPKLSKDLAGLCHQISEAKLCKLYLIGNVLYWNLKLSLLYSIGFFSPFFFNISFTLLIYVRFNTNTQYRLKYFVLFDKTTHSTPDFVRQPPRQGPLPVPGRVQDHRHPDRSVCHRRQNLVKPGWGLVKLVLELVKLISGLEKLVSCSANLRTSKSYLGTRKTSLGLGKIGLEFGRTAPDTCDADLGLVKLILRLVKPVTC